MVTSALRPAIRGRGERSSMAIRIGTRCDTFTQLPLAFCAGNTANSDPVPWPMLSTCPLSDDPTRYVAADRNHVLLYIGIVRADRSATCEPELTTHCRDQKEARA